MKECFINKKFGERSLQLIDHANTIINEYTAAGYDLSVRQLYYQYVSRNILVNSPENYTALANLVSEARIAGLIDWDCIRDRGRVTHTVSTFPDLKTYLQQLNEHFKLDRWATQQTYVEVMVEKQALEGVLLPICQKWGVPFTANKGYSSSSSIYERAKYLQSQRDVEEKEVHVIYLGDHDPSGIDMSRDIDDRLELFSDGPVEVHRAALNFDQVQRHNLPENTAKRQDSRAADYIAKFGESSWELDALDPATLATIVDHAIRSLILDQPAWEEAEQKQLESQDKLQDIIDNLKQ